MCKYLFNNVKYIIPNIFCLQIKYIARKVSKDADLAKFLCSLGYAFERSGEYGRAEPLYLECLKIREAKYGPVHPEVAEVLKDLAHLYSNIMYKQDMEQAGKLFIRA